MNNYNQNHSNFRDHGPKPYVVNIDCVTAKNTNYRTTLWTGNHLQLTVMSIPVGGDIGLEQHPDVDQFLRIESGSGRVYMGNSREEVKQKGLVDKNYAVIVPAGTWHNIVNAGNSPLKLYSLYAPPNHPFGTVDRCKEDEED